MNEHNKMLSARLLGDKQPITYLNVSRSLGCHIHKAKCLLFDFYEQQRSENLDSVYATYLVSGTLHNAAVTADDAEMASQEESADSLVKQNTTMLVEERALQNALSSYASVTSIFIYGLSPYHNEDSCFQSDSEFPLHRATANGEEANCDPQRYGGIHNPRTELRDRHRRPTSLGFRQSSTATKSEGTKVVQKQAPKVIPTETSPLPSTKPGKDTTAKQNAPKSIMQSFAKTVPKDRGKKSEPEKQEDSALALSDDGEADDSDILQSKSNTMTESRAKSRAEREEALRRMMDDEVNEDEADESSSSANEDEGLDEAATVDAEPQPAPEPMETVEPEPSEIVTTSDTGRRRGKRQVLKKKRILDDQGYMVTIQEQGWESFSEDDMDRPTSKKAMSASTPSSSASTKTQKPAAKSTQGNIMSFFGKR